MLLIGHFLEISSFCLLLFAQAAAGVRLKTGRRNWGEAAVRAVYAATLAVTAASCLLLLALVRHDFRFEYVASYTSLTLPLVYRLTAFWAGQAGSLLLWLLLLLAFTSLALRQYRQKYPEVEPPFILFTGGTAIFFNLLLLTFTNPFQPMEKAVADGQGLNPLLQNVGMIFHPPTLFVGYVGFTIPFAFAMGALASGQGAADWMRITRRWALVSWIFLTVGIILGAQWAYVELGWGGYWAWDPVENASFIPWISATAFLHTAILQERRGMYKKWNVFLVSLTFLLCIFGTFITRSGFVESVHAFARSNIGYYFLGYIGLALAVALAVMAWRKDLLRGGERLESLTSKEGTFILTNFALMGFLAVVFMGTIFPTLSEAVLGRKIAIQAPFFNQAVVPFTAVALFLLGLCPVIGWQRSPGRVLARNAGIFALLTIVFAVFAYAAGSRIWIAALMLGLCAAVVWSILSDFGRSLLIRRKLVGESWPRAALNLFRKNKRRWGAYTVHLGVVCLCGGVIGSAYFSTKYEAVAKQGDVFQAGPYRLHYKSFTGSTEPEKDVLRATLEVEGPRGPIAVMTPEKHYHRLHEQPMTEVAIHTSLARDIYIIFSPLDVTGKANFQVLVNPMILWIWIGGVLMTLGALVAMIPNRRQAVLQEITREEPS